MILVMRINILIGIHFTQSIVARRMDKTGTIALTQPKSHRPLIEPQVSIDDIILEFNHVVKRRHGIRV